MKLKSFILSTIAVAIAMGMCSCSKDKDEPEVAVAAQVAGTYTGQEIITVMGDESSNETTSFEFAKTTDSSVDMSIPQSGSMGHMTIPPLSVKNITLLKSGNNITGQLASYAGTVTNADGAEKAYTINNLIVVFSEKSVVVSYALKYGNMPFDMITNFSGTKQ